MARTPRNYNLETRSRRLNLDPSKKPYWSRVGKAGVHLGYRRRRPNGLNVNGSWVARRYKGERNYETETFAEADDATEADGAAVLTYFQAVAKLGAELSEIQRRARYTTKAAVDDYVAWLTLNGTTGKEALQTLTHYLLAYCGAERDLSDVTRDEFSRWPAWALVNPPAGRRKKARTVVDVSDAEQLRKRKERVNRVLNTVLACVNMAFAHERVASDRAWSHLKRFEGTGRARVQWLDLAESHRLLESCENDFRRIVHGGLLTGARWSELRRAQVGDFDPVAKTLLIPKSKSKKPRHIFLTDQGATKFSEWTKDRQRNEFTFTRADGSQWGSHDQHRQINGATKIASVDGTFNVLRHTYASILVQRGVPLKIVAESLGHTTTRMVELHYGHLAPSHVADAIRANLPVFGT